MADPSGVVASPAAMVPAPASLAAEPTQAQAARPGRRPRSRKTRAGDQRGGGEPHRAAAAAAAAELHVVPPPPGITWQQAQFLSPEAAPFQPTARALGDQGTAVPGRQQQQQQQQQQRGGRQPRSGRGRGRSATLGQPDEQPGQQYWEHPPAQPEAFVYDQLDPSQPARPSARQRRRERPPRAQQQQRVGDGVVQPASLEAAASAAANERQRRRQHAEAAGGASEVPSSASDGERADRAVGGGGARPGSGGSGLERQAGRRAAADGGAAAAAALSQAQEADEAGAPQCLVCCHEMAEVAVGACNHRQVCGTCALRLRLCYGRRDCPLCKTELKEVIIAPWRPQLPDWQAYQERPEWVARSAKFARGEIWADRWRRGGRLSSRLLHDLQRRTALACAVCDPGGEAPFARREQLLAHVQAEHGLRLCNLCLQEGRLFPLELEAFDSAEALHAHVAAAHPHCDFCRRTFYDDDALWQHMHQAHYSCHVCPPPAAAPAYFNRAPDLQRHMREEHFMCEEPECADCFVAFATAEELRRHHLERHSARMPRWNSSRARPLQLDISYGRRAGGPPADAAEERRRQRQRPRGSQDVRGEGGGGGSGWPAGWEYAREAEGGLRVIDDAADFPAPAAPSVHGGPVPAGGRAGQPPRAGRAADAFPSLSVAAPAEPGAAAPPAGRPPPLVKKTAKCPCGRRVSHYAVAEGQEVPPLECDAVCRIEGRRRQLANAFDAGDPLHHAGHFVRQRAATYSGLLVAAAQQHPRFVEGLERQLAEFVAGGDAKRIALSAMPREQRRVVHGLAEQYGLATASFGAEPGRYVELLRTPAAGIPARLLSRVAPTVPAGEVARLLAEGEGFPLRLTDIALSVDLRFYLRQWEGAYELEWQGGDAAVVRFQREADRKEALDVLGGGIRGLFRIDRAWQPKTAVAAALPVPPARGAGSAARGWAGAEASGGGSAADSSNWTAVAVAPRAGQRPEAQAPPALGSGGEEQRWAVMTGRRAARPAVPAAAAPATRNVLAELVQEHEDAWTSDGSSESG